MYGGSNLVVVIEGICLQTMNNAGSSVALDRTMHWSLDYYKKNENNPKDPTFVFSFQQVVPNCLLIKSCCKLSLTFSGREILQTFICVLKCVHPEQQGYTLFRDVVLPRWYFFQAPGFLCTIGANEITKSC